MHTASKLIALELITNCRENEHMSDALVGFLEERGQLDSTLSSASVKHEATLNYYRN